jgi:hypothetical protein
LLQAIIIIKERLIAKETMSFLKITFTIVKEDATAEHAELSTTRRRRQQMNEAVTYGGVIYMIIGFTIGRIIGILIIDRLDKKNDK